MDNVLNYLEIAAMNNPNKVAVSFKNEKYTYKKLLKVSKCIGKSIIDENIKDSPIGVIANRSISTLALFFGVLYSGNYYVPIDPDLAPEKMQAILNDCNCPLILQESDDFDKIKLLNYDGKCCSLNSIDVDSEIELNVPVSSQYTPIYMVYTSGSTGKPKGVIKSHGAVISYIEAYTQTFDFSTEEIIGNQTPFYFDASAKDIYLLLKLGCTMEILPTELFSLPPELIAYMNDKKITFASWVPTALSIVAQLNPFSLVKPETLKKMFFVGEVMPIKHLNVWREYLPDVKYVNLYGSSEISGICCYYEVDKTFNNKEALPMGKPLKNCKIYLIDNDEVVTDPNHIGEMYLVSDALALGYYNDEVKTKASFIIKDFGDGEVRCFKTGDLAYYDSDGNLVFCARTDFQIKHMGHRIELGEIEAVANSLDGINRCCCLYNAPKRKIVLFCELNRNTQIKGQEIRSILRTKLSNYMVPGKVIVVDSLPINKNGKIDRQKLKEML